MPTNLSQTISVVIPSCVLLNITSRIVNASPLSFFPTKDKDWEDIRKMPEYPTLQKDFRRTT